MAAGKERLAEKGPDRTNLNHMLVEYPSPGTREA